MRAIIAAAVAVMLTGQAKADLCKSAAAIAEQAQPRLHAEEREIMQRRLDALDTFNASIDGNSEMTWEQLRGRYVLAVMALKEIDDAFRDYIRAANARVDMWVGIANACQR